MRPFLLRWVQDGRASELEFTITIRCQQRPGDAVRIATSFSGQNCLITRAAPVAGTSLYQEARVAVEWADNLISALLYADFGLNYCVGLLYQESRIIFQAPLSFFQTVIYLP
jgi:hypothetical protein